jgi:ISXO2-like transposase domain
MEGMPAMKGGYAHKQKVLSLVERGGELRSFRVENVDTRSIKPIVDANIDKESRLMTDQATYYKWIGKRFADHQSVDHGHEEWVRGDAHTNNLESYYSVFKRGMRGVYQHCAQWHLHRYLAEFDFRHNNRVARGVNDETRATKIVQGVVGRRLTYRTANKGSAP